MLDDVSVLYVDPRGPYPRLVSDFWDENRDARHYFGPNPVVAHPPCGPWGRLKHLYRGTEHDCAPIAVDQVRLWGGILEHPSHSKLFDHMALPKPGEAADQWGGYTIEVCQVDWGHVARKRTGCAVPPGIKVCSAQQRRRTPSAFAEWLLNLARQAKPAVR